MRKQDLQKAFATLTETEMNEVAIRLDGEGCDPVLVRICQPRPVRIP